MQPDWHNNVWVAYVLANFEKKLSGTTDGLLKQLKSVMDVFNQLHPSDAHKGDQLLVQFSGV